ncbi:hypothetical protein V8C42DRAFT_312809 [Trichoderma barbatum]
MAVLRCCVFFCIVFLCLRFDEHNCCLYCLQWLLICLNLGGNCTQTIPFCTQIFIEYTCAMSLSQRLLFTTPDSKEKSSGGAKANFGRSLLALLLFLLLCVFFFLRST